MSWFGNLEGIGELSEEDKKFIEQELEDQSSETAMGQFGVAFVVLLGGFILAFAGGGRQ